MKKHSQRASSIVIAVTALCLVWVLSGQIVSPPAFAEGGSGPCPGCSLPIDTTTIQPDPLAPNGDTPTTGVLDIVILVFNAVL